MSLDTKALIRIHKKLGTYQDHGERVQCRYRRNKGTITISFYNNSQKEVLTIRLRPGWPLDEDEQHYWSISSE